MITVRVPSSTSNLGAGFDCLGMALDLWLEARLVPGAGDPVYHGTLAGLDAGNDLILASIRRTHPEALRDRHLEASSDIPVGKGLGSSAAALVAGAALAQLGTGQPLDRDAVFRCAAQVEGHPDNAAPATYGGLMLAAHRPVPLAFHAGLGCALAVPELGIDTHEARALLPPTVSRGDAIAQASRAAALVLGLTTGDGELIGFGMQDQLAVGHRKHLITGFDAATRAGQAAGAYGVTISGAGSALFAVTPRGREREVAEAMAEALRLAGNPAVPLTPAVSLQGLVTGG